MYLRELAMDSYVLLRADWPAGKASQLVGRLEATHVIVHRVDESLYYLYPRLEALKSLIQAPAAARVRDALGLHEASATPAVDAYTSAEQAPVRCVVLEQGRLVGFCDVLLPPGWAHRRQIGEIEAESTDLLPRSLVADMPEQVRLDEIISLLVSLGAQPGTGLGLPMALPMGTAVDVVVQPQRGFELAGKGEGRLVVTEEEETLPLQFKVRATALGPGRLRVLAFHQGEPLGALTLAPTVVAASEAVARERAGHEQPLSRLSVAQPDLSLLILEHESEGRPAITFRLTAADPSLGLNLKRFGPVQLRMDPLQHFKAFFEDIEGLRIRNGRDQARAEQHLAAKGAFLFETIVPDDLQVLLWSLRDRIRSVVVQSEEPWIPWELCKLQGRENGRVVEGPFMCEAFAMGRWLPGVGRKPVLRLRKMAVVVPRDSRLPFAPSERDYMLSLADDGRLVEQVPATFLDVRTALASGEYDGLHFTGHGGFCAPDPNHSVMLLEGREELTPEDLSGVVRNLGLAQPLVFLNACEIGRGALSLIDIGGWAAQFLHSGAAAFVGAYWSVYDQPAYDFARAFYRRLLAGTEIGQAAQEARLEIRPRGDPTWLAYTLYADPLARVG